MNILVMRRELSQAELSALQRLYPQEEIHPITINPKSAEEHLRLCRDNCAELVFLPHEQPIPFLAMQAGVKHLLLRDDKLLELVRVVPEFIAYEPD